MAIAPACTVTVSLPISRMLFILDILIRVPPSATPTGAVEWLEPTARTGEGYWFGFFRILIMSSTEVASTTTRGCEIRSPNQLVIVGPAAMRSPPHCNLGDSYITNLSGFSIQLFSDFRLQNFQSE